MKKINKLIKSKHHIVKVVAINYGQFSDQLVYELILRNTEASIQELNDFVKWCKQQNEINEFRIIALRRCRGNIFKYPVVLGRLDMTATT